MSIPQTAGDRPERASARPEERYPDPAIGTALAVGAVATPIATAAGTAAGLSATYPAVKALQFAGKTLAAILKLLRRFLKFQRLAQRRALLDLWRRRGLPFVSAVPEEAAFPDLARLMAQEDAYQAEFERKVEERVSRDATRALALPSEAERQAALDAIARREDRYARQRSEAMAIRMFSAVDREYLRRVSPEGAVWLLDPNVKQHTADCLAAAKVGFWPWAAINVLAPPTHVGCRCRLEDPAVARERGLWRPGRKLAVADAVSMMRAIAAMPHDH